MMTQPESWKLIQYYYDNGRREEDKPAFHKICRVLMHEYGDTKAAMASADDYYSDRDFENARRDYQFAVEKNAPYGYIGLGNIWHYGRCGTVDDQKAYVCYHKAIKLLTGREDFIFNHDQKPVLKDEDAYDDLICAVFMTADLYRYGSGVKVSYSVFSSLIHYLFELMKEPDVSTYYMPEVELRMADIVLHDNPDDQSQAFTYLLDARKRMCSRLKGNSFFGDFDLMKEIVMKISDLALSDQNQTDLYDLWHIMKKPCTVAFICENQRYEITMDEDQKIHDRNMTYDSLEEWFLQARIDGKAVSFMNEKCHDFQIEETEEKKK